MARTFSSTLIHQRKVSTAPALPLPLQGERAGVRGRLRESLPMRYLRRTRKRRPRRARADSGFTLIEVVVALAILALSLSVVFAAMSNGTLRVSQADAATKAGSLVQSLLARAGAEGPLREGRADGQ